MQQEQDKQPPPGPSAAQQPLRQRPPEMTRRPGERYGLRPHSLSLRTIVEVLLSNPDQVTDAIAAGQARYLALRLLLVTAAGVATYGVFMGLFSGGPQVWIVPVRVVAGLLLSALICAPSLYVFAALSGARQSLEETMGLLAQALAVSGVVMAGFAPITWVFSQATDSPVFMGTMHLAFWVVSICFALGVFFRAFSRLNSGRVRALHLWGVLFVIVVFQMSTSLRPLVGEFDGYGLQSKRFFLSHWRDALNGTAQTGRESRATPATVSPSTGSIRFSAGSYRSSLGAPLPPRLESQDPRRDVIAPSMPASRRYQEGRNRHLPDIESQPQVSPGQDQ